MKNIIPKILVMILFSLVTTITQGSDIEELNSILGFDIGMSKEGAISRLNEIKLDFVEYPDKYEIDFKYDIMQEGEEMNIIKLFFTDEKLSKICVHFYKYDMLLPMQNSRNFQHYLDELDEIYNNDINWKGKWKSKDGSIIVTTETNIILDKMYDVLMIQQIFKKNNKDG